MNYWLKAAIGGFILLMIWAVPSCIVECDRKNKERVVKHESEREKLCMRACDGNMLWIRGGGFGHYTCVCSDRSELVLPYIDKR